MIINDIRNKGNGQFLTKRMKDYMELEFDILDKVQIDKSWGINEQEVEEYAKLKQQYWSIAKPKLDPQAKQQKKEFKEAERESKSAVTPYGFQMIGIFECYKFVDRLGYDILYNIKTPIKW